MCSTLSVYTLLPAIYSPSYMLWNITIDFVNDSYIASIVLCLIAWFSKHESLNYNYCCIIVWLSDYASTHLCQHRAHKSAICRKLWYNAWLMTSSCLFTFAFRNQRDPFFLLHFKACNSSLKACSQRYSSIILFHPLTSKNTRKKVGESSGKQQNTFNLRSLLIPLLVITRAQVTPIHYQIYQGCWQLAKTSLENIIRYKALLKIQYNI